jgi:hypothetical protein
MIGEIASNRALRLHDLPLCLHVPVVVRRNHYHVR